jgi:cytochrome c
MFQAYVKCWIVYFLIAFCSSATAADLNTPEEAIAMVKKAVAHYKKFGHEKTLMEVSKLKGPFVDKEMFTVIMDAKGVVLAHGFFHKMIGKNIMDMQDHEGTYMVRRMYDVVNTKGAGWVNYKFPNPMTKVIEQKMSYVEKVGDVIIFCGIHISASH